MKVQLGALCQSIVSKQKLHLCLGNDDLNQTYLRLTLKSFEFKFPCRL